MNGRADMLLRRPNILKDSSKEFKPLLRLAAMEACEPVWTNFQIIERIKVAMDEDTTLKPILAFFMNNTDQALTNIWWRVQDYKMNNGILYFHDAIFVPDDKEIKQQILHSGHDAPVAGHQGWVKTLDLVTRTFYRPTL